MAGVPIEEQLEYANTLVSEYSETIQEQQEQLKQAASDLIDAQSYAEELDAQLDQTKIMLNAVNDAINAVTFPW